MDKTGYESVFTRTSPRTAQDHVKPVLCGPVCGPSIFENIRSGPVHGLSPDEPRTGTGPDFKALSEMASSAQLKGVKTIVAGVVDSEMEAGDSEDSEMVGNNGSVVKISQTRD